MGSTRRFLPDTARSGADMYSGMDPLTSEHRKRAELFGRYWNYYNGHHKKRLKPQPGKDDDNVILNWSRRIVDEGLRFLFPEAPDFYQDDDQSNVTPAEAWMREYWQPDAARGWSPSQFLQALGQNGAVCGTAFVKLLPQDGGTVELRAIDPALVDMETDPDDVQTVIAYNIVYKRGSGTNATWRRQRFEVGDDGTSWTVTEAEWQSARWVTFDEQTWPYDFAPIFHCHNLIAANSVWGTSDLEDADLNDAINFTATNISRILRFHAHPHTVGTGFTASQMQETAVGGLWTIADPAARVFNLEMQSDLASSREQLAGLVEAYHQISGVPRLDPAVVNVGALSGFALRILYGPLLAKTRVKRDTYGMLLAQVNRAMLIIGGYGDVPVHLKWADPLPGSDAEQDARIEQLVRAGASLEGAAKLVGYTEDEVQELVNGATIETFPTR